MPISMSVGIEYNVIVLVCTLGVDMSNGIMMYSTTWCPDCRTAKRVFNEEQIAYTEIDIEKDESARELVVKLNGGNQVVPTIVFPDGSMLAEPSAAVLKEKIASLH
jgi:mycoredoxin